MKKFLTLTLSTLLALTSWAQSKEITILSVNDMHASIDRFPQFAALVDSMRTVYPDLLLFAAGDNRTGNPVNDAYPQPSYPMVALMNRAGFNLSTVGNHEFDAGIDAFRNVINLSNFRYISANTFAHDTLRLHIEPYKMFDIDGIRIGVLGLIQRGVSGLPDTHPDRITNLSFSPLAETVAQYIWLRDRCDLFVLLIHDDYEAAIELAQQFPQIDLIISGHSHTRIDSTVLHNNVLITQAESNLKYVSHITLQITDGILTNKESRLLSVNTFPKKDPVVQAMVEAFSSNESLRRVVTEALTDFESYEELGCMMTDAIRNLSGADMAFQNPGGVRMNTLPKGPITVSTLYQLDPFGNEAILFDLSGEEVLRLIQAAYIAENNQAPYVSGITYDLEHDPQGEVLHIDVKMEDGTPLDLQKRYKVVMNSYLSAVSKYEKEDAGQSLFRATADLTIEYLEKQHSIDYQGVKRINITQK